MNAGLRPSTMTIGRRAFLRTAGTTFTLGAAGTAAAQDGATVRMVTEGDDYYFDPIGLHVEPGTTVTFENERGSHNSVSYGDRIPSGASEWETSIGETAEHTFETSGTYDYYCAPHRSLGMVGRIVVGEPGGPAEGGMPPDGEVPESDAVVEAGSVSYDAFTGEGAAGDAPRQRLIGAGLLGGLAALAALVYRLVNSEGEQYRVGSSAWRRRHGLDEQP